MKTSTTHLKKKKKVKKRRSGGDEIERKWRTTRAHRSHVGTFELSSKRYISEKNCNELERHANAVPRLIHIKSEQQKNPKGKTNP